MMPLDSLHAAWTTPIGPLRGVIGETGLRRLEFSTLDGNRTRSEKLERVSLRDPDDVPLIETMVEEKMLITLRETERWLRDYFHAEPPKTTPTLDWSGVPGFHRKVYEWLLSLPFGATTSYGEAARAVGCPDGARAVGQAMNRNPIVLIMPCHRVLAAGKKIGGFGGGLDLKRELLAHEANGHFFR